MSPSRIVELAAIIQEHTTLVDTYLTSNKLPTPSFDISYPIRVAVPPTIQASQEAILDASDELSALIVGPAGISARQPVRTPHFFYHFVKGLI